MSQSNQQNQNENNTMNTKDFIIGALIGGIVGAASALFLAPKSGKELRGDINEQAIILKQKSGQLKDTAVQRSNEFAHVAKEKSSEWSQMIQQQSNELKNKIKSNLPDNNDSVDKFAETEIAATNSNNVEEKLEETKKAFDEAEESNKG